MLFVQAVNNFAQLLFVLLMFAFVLVLTYYSSKWIAGYQKNQMINKNLEIIEAVSLAGNKHLCIVRVGNNRYFLIGVGKDDVSLMGEVSQEDLKEIPSDGSLSKNGRRGQSFEEVLSAFKKHIKKNHEP